MFVIQLVLNLIYISSVNSFYNLNNIKTIKYFYQNKLFIQKINYDPLYIVISNKNRISNKLIEDMDNLGLKNIFLDINYFSKDEIHNLEKQYGFTNFNNNLLVFQDKYLVGDIFDIYSQLFF